MTCLCFILLKAFRVWETPYDYAIGLGLLGLDVLGVAEWTRLWWHKTGR